MCRKIEELIDELLMSLQLNVTNYHTIWCKMTTIPDLDDQSPYR